MAYILSVYNKAFIIKLEDSVNSILVAIKSGSSWQCWLGYMQAKTDFIL